jgi:hypothetical protein
MDEGQENSLAMLEQRLSELRKRVMTLEWDKSHNQLNSGMEEKYILIKAEFEALQKKVGEEKAQIRLKETPEPAKEPEKS